jgi:alpha-ketoglutaric semialdehyde dehydrogenase
MRIEGRSLIGAQAVEGEGAAVFAVSATDGARLEPGFAGVGAAQLDRACALAAEAFDAYRGAGLEDRARFLEAIAANIEALGDALLERAHAETGLPLARLTGERGRTMGQLRLFARVVRDGLWLEPRIDRALPERSPAPRSDLRQRHIPLGPVAVFGASNFPLAFSVAGGDTAAALAAGCPVVVKAHPAHLGTSELVGRAVQAAVAACGLPEGVFSLLFAAGYETGTALVADPRIKAVGFTGSRAGGLALMKTAGARPEPIPVYAEMSSVNPVLILPCALAARPAEIAKGFLASLTLGSGQFCTNPGLVLAVEGAGLDAFVAAARSGVAEAAAGLMLTSGIHAAYGSGVQRLRGEAGVDLIGQGLPGAANQAQAHLFSVTADQLIARPALQEEVFGPASLLVRCRSVGEMREAVERLEGQLTATLQMDDGDLEAARALLPTLERKAGRVLVGGFPTGVEVSDAMVHGGPYPATSDGRSTSVGTLAIRRFLRPVCYQDLPAALLPEELADGNPLGLWRLVEGRMGRE